MIKHQEDLKAFADDLVKQIEANEAVWQKGWKTGVSDILPVNHQGMPYRGENLIYLMTRAYRQGYTDNRWYTYNNAQQQGGHVRKGEKGTVIKFYTNTQQRNKKDEHGNDVLDNDGKPIKETIRLERPIVKTAVVFNAEQIDGLPPRQLTTPLSEWERQEKAEAIIKGIQSQGVTIEHKLGDKAYYSPSHDKIVMPERGQFETADAYYATLLHEIGHSTGHESRLNRDLSGAFGSESYAKEELRAEIASMMIGQELQIGYDPSQHFAYLEHWAKVIKEDPNEIFRAVKDAHEISDYVLGLGRNIENEKASQQSKYTDEQLSDFHHFFNGEPVANIASGQIERDEYGKIITNAKEYMKHWLTENRPDGVFHHPQIGKINFFVRGVKDSISHYGADIHVNALPAVPYVLENSVIIDKSKDKDGKNIENYILASPVSIDNEKHYVVVRLKKELDKDRNPKFYIVSAETETEAQKNAVLTLETRSTHNEYIAGDKNRLLKILHETLAEVKLWQNRNHTKHLSEQQAVYSTSKINQDKEQDKRLYLYTSFNDLNELNELKAQGLVRFDTQNKVWYTHEENRDAVAKWTSRPYVPSPEEALANHLKSQGVIVEAGHPKFDGKSHRLSNDGSKEKNVMYHAHPNYNGIPFATITNFSRGNEPEKWLYPIEYLNTLRNIEAVERASTIVEINEKSLDNVNDNNRLLISQDKGNNYQHEFPSQPYTNQHSQQQQKEELDATKIAQANLMAERTKMLVSICEIAPPDHNYLSKKQITANNTVLIVPDSSKLPDTFKQHIMIANTPTQVREMKDNNPENKMIVQRGNLVIPQYNKLGELRAFEMISYNGGKYALGNGAEKKGISTTLGNLEDGKPVILAEGYATGATLHEQTGRNVVIAFGRNGLLDVAQQLREKYPNSRIYIGADNDHTKPLENKINQGLEDANKVAQTVSNTYVLVPQFDEKDTGKDWNDILVDKGADEFKRQIKEQLMRIQPTIEQENTPKPTPQEQKTQEKEKSIYERLSTAEILKNYPTMSEENLKSIEQWMEVLPNKYSNEPTKLLFSLQRLEDKLPALAQGEILPPPKAEPNIEHKPPETSKNEISGR